MICPHCNEECNPKPRDLGNGYTEAWGIPHEDVDIRWFCDLCESEVDYTPPPIYVDWDV
jgi:hypothetical protein